MSTRRLPGAQGRLHETQGTRSAPAPSARGGGVEALLSASSSSSLSSSGRISALARAGPGLLPIWNGWAVILGSG